MKQCLFCLKTNGSGGTRGIPWMTFFVSFCLCKDEMFVFCCSRPDFRFPVPSSSVGDSHTDSYSTSSVLRRPQKGRLAALRDEPSKVRRENANNTGESKTDLFSA